MATRPIPIREELYQRLSAIATSRGTSPEEVADELLTRTLERHPGGGNGADSAAPRPGADSSFAEIFAPLEQDFMDSGMTEEQLGELIDSEVRAFRAERRTSQQ